MAWSEAFLTGMVLTLMVVYKPEWVATLRRQALPRREIGPLIIGVKMASVIRGNLTLHA